MYGPAPHLRETRSPRKLSQRGRRFISTCAEERAWCSRMVWCRAGLSPHARGTRTRCSPGALSGPVHPRMRGERPSMPPPRNSSVGSSPHTRGTLGPDEPLQARRRFIPAYAGNASGANEMTTATTVHPRIRGERERAERNQVVKDGPSPHTRGTP